MNGGLGTNWGAQRAEQFPHLGNYNLTPCRSQRLKKLKKHMQYG